MKEQQVLLVGYGEMGHAMERLLSPRHHVTIWQRHTPAGETATSLTQQARDKDAVIFCVPTAPLHRLASELRADLPSETICLSMAKGLDDTGRPAFYALRDALGDSQPLGVIYGPMIAEEISAGRPAYAQVGIADRMAYDRVAELFSGSALRIRHSMDTIGLSWCAVLKNVYAIGFGIADGLGLGDNVRGWLAVTALRELAAIAVEHGGGADAPYDLAGLGDLITTATSEGSHHHGIGLLLAHGEREGIEGEGVHTLKLVGDRNLVRIDAYPLFATIAASVHDPANLAEKWRSAVMAIAS
jgi:glycerol-3-phosphate dehydrogenase (NAD(P)+)